LVLILKSKPKLLASVISWDTKSVGKLWVDVSLHL
jgi:hypothetical protein